MRQTALIQNLNHKTISKSFTLTMFYNNQFHKLFFSLTANLLSYRNSEPTPILSLINRAVLISSP